MFLSEYDEIGILPGKIKNIFCKSKSFVSRINRFQIWAVFQMFKEESRCTSPMRSLLLLHFMCFEGIQKVWDSYHKYLFQVINLPNMSLAYFSLPESDILFIFLAEIKWFLGRRCQKENIQSIEPHSLTITVWRSAIQSIPQ